jgi:hypothetical protein
MCSEDELAGELDRALLEVLPEREVPEHLEEREVVPVEADLVDVDGRKHFCDSVVRSAGGGSWPRKNGICGCIPAVVRSVESSPARGTSEYDGQRRWPRSSKNERKPSRSSAVVRILDSTSGVEAPGALRGGGGARSDCAALRSSSSSLALAASCRVLRDPTASPDRVARGTRRHPCETRRRSR